MSTELFRTPASGTLNPVFRAIKRRPLAATTVALYAIELLSRYFSHQLSCAAQIDRTTTDAYLSPIQKLKITTFERLAKAIPQDRRAQMTLRMSSTAVKVCALICLSWLLKRQFPGGAKANTVLASLLSIVACKLHAGTVQCEGEALSHLLSEKNKQVKAEQDILLSTCKARYPNLSSFFAPRDAHTTTLVFKGFGTVLTKEDNETSEAFADRANEYVQGATPIWLKGGAPDYTMQWLKVEDQETWTTCKTNFDRFQSRYQALLDCSKVCLKKCNKEELKLMEEFAKVYHFNVLAGNVSQMERFLNETNKTVLMARFPDQHREIETVFAKDSLGHLPAAKLDKIRISGKTVSFLLDLWVWHLDNSLRQGALSELYKEVTGLLQRILVPMEGPCKHKIFSTLQKMLTYSTALEHQGKAKELIHSWKGTIHTVFEHAVTLPEKGNRFYGPVLQEHMVVSCGRATETACLLHRETQDHPWLVTAEQRIRFDNKALIAQSMEIATRALIKRPLSMLLSPFTWIINHTVKPVGQALKNVEKMSKQGQTTFDEVMGRVRKTAQVLSGRHLAHKGAEFVTGSWMNLKSRVMDAVTIRAKTD